MDLPWVQHKTIDSVLARGERLDSLVDKSSDLSAASQVISISLHILLCAFIHYLVIASVFTRIFNLKLCVEII